MQKITDFIVIGSGIAGLHAAQTLAEHGKVLIITKGAIRDSATKYAQGGIAAVTHENDSIAGHIDDTLRAGSYYNSKDAVTFLVQGGAKAIHELLELGVPFDKKPDGTFATSFEAAHNYPRIFHATDFTGQAIEEALVSSVVSNNNIEVWEHAFATDLVVRDNECFGVICRDVSRATTDMIFVFARATVLASGGAGQVYQWTVTPLVATGDGIAMAHRAGVKLIDLEFMQFHPTALQDQRQTPMFLLSEALRGEGAMLVDSTGNRFIQEIHPQGELAPRDVVARAIFQKQKTGDVYLDMRHKKKTFLKNRFPNIYRTLEKRGFDLAKDLIPVTPAAHFMCGGVVTDLYGRTSVKNLFAYGEVAATGVHGANRLASNSLLEGFVFSSQIEKCLPSLRTNASFREAISSRSVISQGGCSTRGLSMSGGRNDGTEKQVKEIMWQYVGIERNRKNLLFAIKTLSSMLEKMKEFPVHETKNIVQVALLIAEAAYRRKKSLGAHYMAD